MFGPVRMRLDTFGCVWMHLGAFGDVWEVSGIFGFFAKKLSFCDGFGPVGITIIEILMYGDYFNWG